MNYATRREVARSGFRFLAALLILFAVGRITFTLITVLVQFHYSAGFTSPWVVFWHTVRSRMFSEALPLASTLVFLAAIVWLLQARLARLIVPQVEHACEECGYSLRNLKANRCPECGTEVPKRAVMAVADRSTE